ncbi:MAG: helix-turn-helix domain-containing protein [Rhodospirillaceae bacterium]|jgi:excisionase family DNA binding protein|nr:helix-turn-helix domain-containing protein [Rhodospirillaceae bacterium]
MEDEAYSIKETARRLSLSSRHVYRLISRGEIQSVLVGRRRLIRRKDLIQFLNKLPNQSAY